MSFEDILFIAFLAIFIAGMILATICEREARRLEQENWMLRRLLSEQATLQEMSLSAYIAMLQEAQRHVGG